MSTTDPATENSQQGVEHFGFPRLEPGVTVVDFWLVGESDDTVITGATYLGMFAAGRPASWLLGGPTRELPAAVMLHCGFRRGNRCYVTPAKSTVIAYTDPTGGTQ